MTPFDVFTYLFVSGMLVFLSGLLILIWKSGDSVAWLVLGICLISISLICIVQSQILSNEIKQEQDEKQKNIDRNQTSYLDSHDCKDVANWLSKVNHNKINATEYIKNHARDILISECLK